MSYEEFKKIISLMQSPDKEVVELGRQLFPKKEGCICVGMDQITEIRVNKTIVTLGGRPISEYLTKLLYADIFGINE